MKRIIYFIAIGIIIAFTLMLTGFSGLLVQKGSDFRGAGKLKQFYEMPGLFWDVIKNSDERLVTIKDSEIVPLRYDKDLYYVNARFADNTWVIELKKLGNMETIFSWEIKSKNIQTGDRLFSHCEPQSPLILADTSLIVYLDHTKNLFKLDSKSNIVWENHDRFYHHTFNPGGDGSIWICAEDEDKGFLDNYLVKVDVSSGKTTKNISLAELFVRKGMLYMLGQGNKIKNSGTDPFHLNDIQPTLKSTKYWEKGDLLFSLRHRSAIVQYRPDNDSVIRVIQGPFLNQHDVDIQNDSCISFFNNSAVTINRRNKVVESLSIDQHSSIVTYDLGSENFSFPYYQVMKENKLFTQTQGLHHMNSDGTLFVELQNKGFVALLSKDSVLYLGPLNNAYPGRKEVYERTYWPRIYEHSPI